MWCFGLFPFISLMGSWPDICCFQSFQHWLMKDLKKSAFLSGSLGGHLVVVLGSIPTVYYQNPVFGSPGEYSPQALGWRGWGPALCSWWDNGEKKWDLWPCLASKYVPIYFTVFGTKRFGALLIWEDPVLTCLTRGSWQTETNRFLGSKSLLSRLCQLSCLVTQWSCLC